MPRPTRPQRDLSAQDGNPTSLIQQRYTELMAIQDPEELVQAAEALVQPLVGHGFSPGNHRKFMMNLQQSARKGLTGIQMFLSNYMLKGSGLGVNESNEIEAVATFLCEDTNSIKLTKRQRQLKRLVESAGFKVISELSRREFMQRSIGGLASGNVLSAVGGKALGAAGGGVDPLAKFSNAALLEMPEEDWLPFLRPARLQQMLSNPESKSVMLGEIGNKFFKALCYGVNYCKSGEMLKMLAQKCEADPAPHIAEFLNVNLGTENLGYAGVNADKFLGTLKELGIRPTPDLIEIARDLKNSVDDEPEAGPEPEPRPTEKYKPRPDDEFADSSMHQPFESKLRAALGLI